MPFSFRLLSAALCCGLGVSLTGPAPASAQSSGVTPPPDANARPALTVCADPQNLPYTDDHFPGFESRIADLVANDLGMDVKYAWERSYRGFLKRTLFAGACNVVIGVPTGLPGVAVTRPYYASSYVAVMRASDTRHFTSFDDAWLKDAKIGVPLIGTDRSYIPPTVSLAVRGVDRHIIGFPVRASTPVPNPQGLIIDAVADGRIDIAFVWGPVAGYFAKFHDGVLRMDKITGDPQNPELIFSFPTSLAVRSADKVLADRLQGAIDRHPTEIAAILSDYNIPTVPIPQQHAQLPGNEIAQKAGSSPPIR